jgi:hypothetical protein
MKKQLVLVFAATLLFASACEQSDPQPTTYRNTYQSQPPLSINSFYPKAAPSGSSVAIFGENFGSTISDNLVTFDSVRAEVTQVQPGFMVVKVPMNLRPGDYTINLSANGQTVTSPSVFSVINDVNQ